MVQLQPLCKNTLENLQLLEFTLCNVQQLVCWLSHIVEPRVHSRRRLHQGQGLTTAPGGSGTYTAAQQLFVSFLRRSSGNWDWYGDYGIKCPQINSHRQARYKHLNQMECTQHTLGVLAREQRVHLHKCQPMGPAASARGGARGVPGGLTGPHLVSTSCHCCSAGINLTINQINRLTSFNCSIVSVTLSRIKVIFWWEDPGIGRMIKEIFDNQTQLWRKRWRSSGAGQIMNGAGRGILLLLQTDTDCAERAHKIWEMLICSLQSRPKLPQTAALARFNS